MTTTSYRARPIKRHRRTRDQINEIRQAILDIVSEDPPMTCRQVFYQAVSSGVVPKTEKDYKQVVCRLLGRMREEGQLAYEWIADNTRWMRKPTTYDNAEDALRTTAQAYRRSLWNDQNAYVEIWLEKDALAGVIVGNTSSWDVPLMVTRGYPSSSFVYEAAQTIRKRGKTCYLYYFGDRDPSGVDIDRSTEAKLRRMAPESDIIFERVAVTPEQIDQYNLPTRPTKKSDSRANSFEGESVELDAIPAGVLRGMVEDCILRHIDSDQLDLTRRIEELERETLAQMAETFGDRRRAR